MVPLEIRFIADWLLNIDLEDLGEVDNGSAEYLKKVAPYVCSNINTPTKS